MIARTKIDRWCEAAIEAGWLAALIVAPLAFNVFSSRVFEPDKISLLRTLALFMSAAWLLKVINGGPAWLPAYQRGDDPAGSPAGDGSSAPAWRRFLHIPFMIPILLLILAYAVGTLFSVARFVSWWGSYQRLQGSYTFLTYVVIALLTMAHLRRPQQIRRLQYAIIITSLPIAIYGIIQHYGHDPLPWGGDVSRRIAANAGNAIFLAAYLIMAVFFTIERVYSSFAYLIADQNGDQVQDQSQDIPAALAGGAYLFILMVQLLAIFWTQSRGPWLGLFLGIYVFVLLTLSALRPRHYRGVLAGWVGIGILGVLLLVLMNTSSLFDPLRSVPYVGRFTQLLDQQSRTGQVRILIWQGANDMVAPHDALAYPDGSSDRVNLLRPLIGYGPETMWVTFNPFYPPDLAYVEKRNASPDRSHNETWDSLVITGILGFVAYMSLFISIFYWALRWLGLLVNRRDKLLFAGLLSLFSIASILIFYLYDGSWRFFGVALPAGLEAGLVLYIMLAPFLHPDYRPNRADIPRQLLIVAILATVAAHFVEIHFGIAIASTRIYFWVLTALLLVLGMRWALVEPFAKAQPVDERAPAAPASAAKTPSKRSRGKRGRTEPQHQAPAAQDSWPLVPSTVLIVQLIFLTFVFIYTTNSQGLSSAPAILFQSILGNGPFLLILMLFTWLVGAGIGFAEESLSRPQGAPLSWWLRGLVLHGLIVWGSWLAYGLIQARRLIPGIAGRDLDSQLNQVANHFALYTWVMIIWVLAAATVWAWPWLRDRQIQIGRRLPVTAVAAVALVLIVMFAVANVNIALVRADVIYKQGQQFDSQRNWVSSVELYRRALKARETEDHYMLFLGRGLLEQAKLVTDEGAPILPADPELGDVLTLNSQEIAQMPRQDLLRAADVVLAEAQRVNPLNTDHTANRARLYRTWADLTQDDPDAKEALLDKSLAQYELAVLLSPNAAHLWNEKANAYLSRGEQAEAEATYAKSLSIDPLYDQTYMLLADFYNRREEYGKTIDLLDEGIAKLNESPLHQVTPGIYSYLGVAQARSGDRAGAIESNLRALQLSPNDLGAMRNLVVLYRDEGAYGEAVDWANRAIEATSPERVAEIKQLRMLLVDLYAQAEENDQILAQYELIRQLDPNDLDALLNLSRIYTRNQDWNSAVDVLQALALLEPQEYRHPMAIAQILAEVGQPENARTFAELALELAPDDQKTAIVAFIESVAGE